MAIRTSTLRLVYALDKDPKWLQIMHSIAEHAATSYRDMEIAPILQHAAIPPHPTTPAELSTPAPIGRFF